MARIFAKSLNCERGTGADPCGECETCLAIDAGRYIDLLEIDAASNTGVDNVRDLIENAQYMPPRGRYKEYLIDRKHVGKGKKWSVRVTTGGRRIVKTKKKNT